MSNKNESKKKVTKTNESDYWVGGVLGGICKHYDLDPFLIRISYLLLILGTSGGLILLYLIVSLMMPDEEFDPEL